LIFLLVCTIGAKKEQGMTTKQLHTVKLLFARLVTSPSVIQYEARMNHDKQEMQLAKFKFFELSSRCVKKLIEKKVLDTLSAREAKTFLNSLSTQAIFSRRKINELSFKNIKQCCRCKHAILDSRYNTNRHSEIICLKCSTLCSCCGEHFVEEETFERNGSTICYSCAVEKDLRKTA
jgi:formylmethanofuran dehydrogenase subunit E